MKAREIMKTEVLTIRRDTTIGEIAHLFADNDVSGVPVIDDDGTVAGMVTQKDLLYKDMEPRFPAVVEILGGLIFLDGGSRYNEDLKKITATRAEDIMTSKVISVKGDTELGQIARFMIEKDISRVPVEENGRLLGIIGREDIIRHIAASI